MARKRVPPRRSGFLTIDKPPGMTSHDVVGVVRRVTGERQVGHAGTLDPAASGVLPVAVGHATKVLPFIEDDDKRYVATVRFGVETDSADRDGRLIARADAVGLTRARIEALLAPFRGEILQIPPVHSAIKVAGRPLYEHARAGAEVEVPERRVTIHRIELVDWRPPEAMLAITCSKGTYIRSIARDLGAAAGTGAMLSSLVRTAAGRFELTAAIPLDALAARLADHGWARVALHPDAVMRTSAVVVLDSEGERRWFHGLPLDLMARTATVRVYDSRRAWVGIGVADPATGRILPRRVIRGTDE
jgi:tRNA pseudouridine55 synthase